MGSAALRAGARPPLAFLRSSPATRPVMCTTAAGHRGAASGPAVI
jgi:hypothetical protein